MKNLPSFVYQVMFQDSVAGLLKSPFLKRLLLVSSSCWTFLEIVEWLPSVLFDVVFHNLVPSHAFFTLFSYLMKKTDSWKKNNYTGILVRVCDQLFNVVMKWVVVVWGEAWSLWLRNHALGRYGNQWACVLQSNSDLQPKIYELPLRWTSRTRPLF